MTPLGIVIATHIEAGALLRRFAFRRVDRGLYEATVDGRRVLVAISGVGADAARCTANRLVDAGAGELVSAGFCGALVENLNVGDLVTERIASTATPAKTRAERVALTARANAVAVDMETQAVIEAGTRRGVPIRVLRVVSDRLSDDLTPLFGRDIGFSPFRIALRLLKPTVWPLASQLHRHSRIAKQRLADVFADYVRTANG